MRRQMAHKARPSILGSGHGRRRPVGREARHRLGDWRDGLGGPAGALLGIGVIALVGIVLLGAGVGAAGGRPGAAFGPPARDGPATSETGSPDAAVLDAAGTPLPTAPPCAQGDVLTPNRGPDDWARTILDTTLMLPENAEPPDLVRVTEAGIAGSGKVRGLVIGDLRALASSAAADGVRVSVDSAYRSYAQQVASFESYAKAYGDDEALKTVARPGHSEHQLGTTVDFAGDLPWLAANAPAFGFVMSYPADASPGRTCYRPEAWHFRYVGPRTALRVAASGLSLREWLWRNQP